MLVEEGKGVVKDQRKQIIKEGRCEGSRKEDSREMSRETRKKGSRR